LKVPSKVLLVVGSPQKERSTSSSLGNFLMDRMKERGASVERVFAYDLFDNEAMAQEALQMLSAADLVVMASPVYVDSLPSQVMRFMEQTYARLGPGSMSGKHFVGMVNMAFSEKVQGETAVRIMHEYALDMGFSWTGGLILPQGPMIMGRRMDEIGGSAHRVKGALQMTAEAIMSGNDTPREAKEMMARTMAPPWIYNIIVNHMFKKQAAQNGVKRRLYDIPYK